MRRGAMIALVVSAWVAAGAYGQGIVYVNGATGSDAWDGRCEVWDGGICGPKATIQAAIDVALAGEQVLIADGIYAGTGNKDVDFGGKAITVGSASGDPAMCVIDCEGVGRGFYFHSGETASSIVAGLTIRNGVAGLGGGVYCTDPSSPTLTNCTLTGNTANYGGGFGCAADIACLSNPTLINCTIVNNRAAGGDGGGVYISSYRPTLTNCTIANNTASRAGGGVSVYGYAYPELHNCTLTGNWAPWGGGFEGGPYCCPMLMNCTITGNTASIDGGGVVCAIHMLGLFLRNCILWGDTPQEIFVGEYPPDVTYCDVQGGWSGTGNIDLDPLFADADGRLTAESPCVDAGDPGVAPLPGAVDPDGHTRLWDGNGDGIVRVDIGAYEFGSHSYGDLNCDGLLNAFDIDPFVVALTGPEAYATAFPGCDYMLADVNCDGSVNAFDIDPFVQCLTGGGCPARP